MHHGPCFAVRLRTASVLTGHAGDGPSVPFSRSLARLSSVASPGHLGRATSLGSSEVTGLAYEDLHIAMPQLRGQPAYARPPRPPAETPRPFDPDDLPIVALMTDEERAIAEALPGRPYLGTSASGHGPQKGHANGLLRPRALLLRSLAGKILRGNS